MVAISGKIVRILFMHDTVIVQKLLSALIQTLQILLLFVLRNSAYIVQVIQNVLLLIMSKI